MNLGRESDDEGGLILTSTDEGSSPGAEGVEACFVRDVGGGGGVEETEEGYVEGGGDEEGGGLGGELEGAVGGGDASRTEKECEVCSSAVERTNVLFGS